MKITWTGVIPTIISEILMAFLITKPQDYILAYRQLVLYKVGKGCLDLEITLFRHGVVNNLAAVYMSISECNEIKIGNIFMEKNI